MALNGIDPLLIIDFKLPPNPPPSLFGPPAELSLLQSLGQAIGIPIPIYLSERVTGIYVDNESSSVDVETQVEAVSGSLAESAAGQTTPPVISQQVAASLVTVNMLAKNDSILLVVLLALMQEIVSRVVAQTYSISYLNGSTALFGGMLHRFATSVSKNDDLVRIELTLSTASKQPPTPKAVAAPIANVTGAIPL